MEIPSRRQYQIALAAMADEIERLTITLEIKNRTISELEAEIKKLTTSEKTDKEF